MSSITLTVPDEIAGELQRQQERVPELLQRVMRELNADELGASGPAGFAGAAEVFEFLASLPSPEAVMDLRPSVRLDERVRSLLEKNRTRGLTPQEEKEWERYEFLEHLVRLAKANALRKLGTTTANV
jgi:hypothetical protein